MRRHVKAGMVEAAKSVEVSSDGMSMTEFGEALKCHPSDVPEVVQYLHLKRVIWMSSRGGHVRVFPASMAPGRGRPPVVKKNVDDPVGAEIIRLLGDLVPNFLRLRRLEADRPETWTPAKFANDQAMNVEAEHVMRRVRKFARWNPGVSPEAIRAALWFDRPDLMKRVAECQSELALGSDPFSKPEAKVTKMEAGLSHDDRVYRYVKAAGKNGIAAYEVAKMFGGILDTAGVIDVANMLENGGMIRMQEMRKGGKGRLTQRLFDIAFEPDVTETGTFYMR